MIQEMSLAVKNVCDGIAFCLPGLAWVSFIPGTLAIVASLCSIVWFLVRFNDRRQQKKKENIKK